jgi:hypothetical protein
MTVSPNPVVTGQTIFVRIYTGSYCAFSGTPFTIYAFHDNPMQTITLGWGVAGYTGLVFFHTAAPPPGVWRINADTNFCASSQTDSWRLVATQVIETVKPKPAPAPPVHEALPKPVAKPSPRASPSPSPSPTPTASVSEATPSPQLAHALANVQTPGGPFMPAGAAAAAIVLAATAALSATLLWYRRRRLRPHR